MEVYFTLFVVYRIFHTVFNEIILLIIQLQSPFANAHTRLALSGPARQQFPTTPVESRQKGNLAAGH